MRAALFAFAALVASACGGAQPPPPPPPPTAPSHASLSGRSLALVVELAAPGKLHVAITASGSADEMRSWQLGTSKVDALTVHDGSGRLLVSKSDGPRLVIDGVPGIVVVDYDVVSDSPTSADVERPLAPNEDVRATMVEAARFRGVGAGLLALPIAFEAKVVDVAIDVRVKETLVATSFGIAKEHVKRELKASGAMLRRAAFLGGPGGRAEFDAPEGHDEAAWLGYPAFDPRAVAAEVAGFRGLLHDYFKDYELAPASLFFAVDARPRAHFRVARVAAGVLVTLSGADPYDAPLRLSVAHELVHAWLGEQIWMGDTSPGHEAESWWFHEGFARWVAREQLARAGLLSSDEYAAEVNRSLAIVTTARNTARTMRELLADRTAPGVLSLIVARGVLYASMQDARIREKSKGAWSLDDTLRALARDASEHKGVLPEGALRDRLDAELGGATARDDFDDVVMTGRRAKLPDSALGACFEARDVAYDVYEPGFDVAASQAANVMTGVGPKGPAALAGLHDGDAIVALDLTDRVDQPAKIVIDRAGTPVTITYKPTSGTKRGQSFRRKPSLTEDACKKLMPRH